MFSYVHKRGVIINIYRARALAFRFESASASFLLFLIREVILSRFQSLIGLQLSFAVVIGFIKIGSGFVAFKLKSQQILPRIPRPAVDTRVRKSGETSQDVACPGGRQIGSMRLVHSSIHHLSIREGKRTRIWNLSRLSGSALLRTHTYRATDIDHSFCLVISRFPLLVSLFSLIAHIGAMETSCIFHFAVPQHFCEFFPTTSSRFVPWRVRILEMVLRGENIYSSLLSAPNQYLL